MEFCAGGDLYAAIRKGSMSATEVECCFKQLLTGVDYIHKQGVAHRDIKPENLFFDARGQLKVRSSDQLAVVLVLPGWLTYLPFQIGDLGSSTVYRLPWEYTIHKSSGLCGSEPYIAPEQFLHSCVYPNLRSLGFFVDATHSFIRRPAGRRLGVWDRLLLSALPRAPLGRRPVLRWPLLGVRDRVHERPARDHERAPACRAHATAL